MPGPKRTGPKLIHIDSIGKVLTPGDLQLEILNRKGMARPVCEVKKTSGDKWTLAWIDPIGIAVASHQSQQVWVISAKNLIDLACEAGVEDRLKFLTLPSMEVDRGS